jgi:hypothetical protein
MIGLVIASALSTMLIGDVVEVEGNVKESIDYSLSRYVADKKGVLATTEIKKIFQYNIDKDTISKELAFTDIRLNLDFLEISGGRITIKNLKSNKNKILSEIDLDIEAVTASNKLNSSMIFNGKIFVDANNINLNMTSDWWGGGEAELLVDIKGDDIAISKIISRLRWLIYSGDGGIMEYVYAVVGQDDIEVKINFTANDKITERDFGILFTPGNYELVGGNGFVINELVKGGELIINYKDNIFDIIINNEDKKNFELVIQDMFHVDGIWSYINDNQIIKKLNLVIDNPILLLNIISKIEGIKEIKDRVFRESVIEIQKVSHKDERYFGLTPGVVKTWNKLYSQSLNNKGIIVVGGLDVKKICGNAIMKYLLTHGEKKNIFRKRNQKCNIIWNKLYLEIKRYDEEIKKTIDIKNKIPLKYQDIVQQKLRNSYGNIAKKLSEQFGLVRKEVLDFLVSPMSIKINSNKTEPITITKLKEEAGWFLKIEIESGDWQDVNMALPAQ